MDIAPSFTEFARLAKQGNVVPIWTELLADLDTPVSAFLKLDDGRTSFLLESVDGEEKIARYSFIGSDPKLIVRSRGGSVEIEERDRSGKLRPQRLAGATNPLDALEQLSRRYRAAPVPELPRFYGGFVGYLSYDTVRYIERLPEHRHDALAVPDLLFMLTESMVIFDHAQHTMRVVTNVFTEGRSLRAAYRDGITKLKAVVAKLSRSVRRQPPLRAPRSAGAVRSNMTKAEFVRIVERAKQYIRSGDIIQVVLAQRFDRTVGCRPLDIYRALRSLNPSPYMYFLRFGGQCLVGASPEMLVRCEDGRIETRPIAGTRKRGKTPAEEAQLIQQLQRSPKERAEHLMLVDLGRNDLGRVAQIGSVTTPELMIVEKYSHVMHLVSSVQAKLAKGKHAFDVLRAAFPAGTVSGAPKVRAMQIIAELERDRRGPYAGAVGYLSFTGNLDLCITIRTILMRGQSASVQAGAGIVADSNAAREYQETINKAQGCLRAIDVAEERAQ